MGYIYGDNWTSFALYKLQQYSVATAQEKKVSVMTF